MTDYPSVLKKASVRLLKRTKMSVPTEEGDQDDDDILGFPGDGFEDKTDTNPGVLGEHDEEDDDTRMDEAGGDSSQGSAKKRKKSAVVSPDGFVAARIKALKVNPPSVIRRGWYGWSKPTIRYP